MSGLSENSTSRIDDSHSRIPLLSESICWGLSFGVSARPKEFWPCCVSRNRRQQKPLNAHRLAHTMSVFSGANERSYKWDEPAMRQSSTAWQEPGCILLAGECGRFNVTATSAFSKKHHYELYMMYSL